MAERETGTVKWFNAGKATVSLNAIMAKAMSSCITAPSTEPDSKRWMKVSGLNLMLSKVTKDPRLKTLRPWVKASLPSAQIPRTAVIFSATIPPVCSS